MIGSGGDLRVFWSNPLVGTITTLAVVLLFWSPISKFAGRLGGLVQPVRRAS
jgi:hypothetical protein